MSGSLRRPAPEANKDRSRQPDWLFDVWRNLQLFRTSDDEDASTLVE